MPRKNVYRIVGSFRDTSYSRFSRCEKNGAKKKIAKKYHLDKRESCKVCTNRIMSCTVQVSGKNFAQIKPFSNFISNFFFHFFFSNFILGGGREGCPLTFRSWFVAGSVTPHVPVVECFVPWPQKHEWRRQLWTLAQFKPTAEVSFKMVWSQKRPVLRPLPSKASTSKQPFTSQEKISPV